VMISARMGPSPRITCLACICSSDQRQVFIFDWWELPRSLTMRRHHVGTVCRP
jgi:hypothetical protein